ncbi:MAG: hypothetical protein FWG83_02395 [Oscillospiraceae bacterium]|nr:hypothetical protein [Oscillospiraceae bacterium]
MRVRSKAKQEQRCDRLCRAAGCLTKVKAKQEQRCDRLCRAAGCFTGTGIMRVRLVTILLSLVLILTGCYWNVPVIDLISPPKLTGEQTEIYNALTNSMGSALTLKYPKTGEYLSAFVYVPTSSGSVGFSNMANLSSERVMVFYSQSGTSAPSEPTVFITFLEKRGEKWEPTNTESFFATDIEKIEFSDLGDSPQLNIIISYSILNQNDKSLCVISFDGEGKPDVVYHRDFCMYYEVGDFNDSGSRMLISINRSGGETNQSAAYFAGWKDGDFMTVDSVDANPNAFEYVKSTKSRLFSVPENVADGKPVVFLEYSQSDSFFNTGIIVYNPDGTNPRNIVFTEDEVVREERLELLVKRPNQYTAHAYSRDIDDDGRVEVAGNRLFPGYESDLIVATDKARATIWYSITEEEGFVKRHYTYLSVNNDYVLFFPIKWQEKVTVTINNDNPAGKEVVFWEYDAEKHESYFDAVGEDGVQLLKIVTVPKGEPRPDGYGLYNDSKNERFDYYVKVVEYALQPWELILALKIL